MARQVFIGKTTTKQQIEFAHTLYETICAPTTLQSSQYDLELTMRDSSIEQFVRWKGIRVDWLLDHFFQLPYLKRLSEYHCPMWFVRKVCMTELLNQHSVASGAVVDHIVETFSGEAQDVSSCATVFVSYTGRYNINGFQKILEQLRGEYIWIDIFCVDQFAWNRRKDDDTVAVFANMLLDRLSENIRKIGRTVLIIEKWDDIKYTLNQIWVLWEVFSTVEAESNFDILLTHDEAQRYYDALLDGSDSLRSTTDILSNIHSNHALSANPIEQHQVKLRMQSLEGGLHNVDSTVTQKTRQWLIDSARRYLEFLELSNGGWNKLIHVGYLNFGYLLMQQSLYEEAVMILERVFRYGFSNFGADSYTIGSLFNAGVCLTELGSLDKAEEFLLACSDFEQLLEGGVVSIQFSLAQLYKKQGRLAEAEELHRKTLEILEDCSEEHQQKLLTLSNLGIVLKEQGRYQEAEVIQRKVLEIRKRILIDDHASIINTTSNLAVILRNQRKFGEAEQLYRYVLQHRQRIYGDENPDTHVAMMNLGNVLLDQGKFEASEDCYHHVLREQEKLYGRESNLAMDTIHNMARLMDVTNRHVEAEKLYDEVLQFRKLALGNEHPHTLSTMNNLGTVFLTTNS